MKINYILFIYALVFLTACNKDFLNRMPLTSVTENNTFKTSSDLELYTNSMYGMLGPNLSDGFTDNIAGLTGSTDSDNMVRGTLNINNVSGWDSWGNLRRINFMLQNVGNTQGDAAAINHFIGIARFYRANWYYNMVITYGDVP